DVLAILQVDLFEALREYHADACAHFREGCRLPRATAPLLVPADDDGKAAAGHGVARNRVAAQAHQAITRERPIVIIASPGRRQLVGRDVVEQGALGIEGQCFPSELPRQQISVRRQVEHAPREAEASVAHDLPRPLASASTIPTASESSALALSPA